MTHKNQENFELCWHVFGKHTKVKKNNQTGRREGEYNSVGFLIKKRLMGGRIVTQIILKLIPFGFQTVDIYRGFIENSVVIKPQK